VLATPGRRITQEANQQPDQLGRVRFPPPPPPPPQFDRCVNRGREGLLLLESNDFAVLYEDLAEEGPTPHPSNLASLLIWAPSTARPSRRRVSRACSDHGLPPVRPTTGKDYVKCSRHVSTRFVEDGLWCRVAPQITISPVRIRSDNDASASGLEVIDHSDRGVPHGDNS